MNVLRGIDNGDNISVIAYICQLPLIELYDIEALSKIIFNVLNSYSSNTKLIDNYLNILSISNNFFVFPPYQIFINENYLFKIIVLTSIKHVKFPLNDSFFTEITDIIVKSFRFDIPQSVYLLKLLEVVLKKLKNFNEKQLKDLLKFLVNVTYSPFQNFKYYTKNISNILLKYLPNSEININFHDLPSKYFDTKNLVTLFSEEQINGSISLIVKQILRSFYNNIDNREGSFYYKGILKFYSFEKWQIVIYPLVLPDLENVDNDGEFLQSLLKYWIPINVKQYKSDFYAFLRDEPIDFQLKPHILVETKKRGFSKDSFNTDIYKYLTQCSSLGLKIVSCYSNKAQINDFDLDNVIFFLNNYTKTCFDAEIEKNLRAFFSQLFLIGHKNFKKYSKFTKEIYQFCLFKFNNETLEISISLLKIIWDTGESSNQELSKEENFYKQLHVSGVWKKTFENPLLLNTILTYLENHRTCHSLIQLFTQRYINLISLNNLNVTELFMKKTEICLQNIEIIRDYAHLLIVYKNSKNLDYSDDISDLVDLFNDKITNLDNTENIFTCVLLLEFFSLLIKSEHFNAICLIQNCLKKLDEIFSQSSDFIDLKKSKALEALINALIKCFVASKSRWECLEKVPIFKQLCKIIQRSNMKKPVSITAKALQEFATSVNFEIKLKFLTRILNCLSETLPNLQLKIRRNPESRLIIHAICLSEKTYFKPLLTWSMVEILKIIENPATSDATLSSCFHSLEVLITENTFQQITLPFIPQVITNCIVFFSKTNWSTRNAVMQLTKSLIEKFLGVSLSYGCRPKTIQDLFTLFPHLEDEFLKILTRPVLSDSVIIVLLFLAESQQKKRLVSFDLSKFQRILMNLIKTNTTYGYFLIKSYSSLCLTEEIPEKINEIVDFIMNFKLPTNVFANLISLISELMRRYLSSIGTCKNDFNSIISLVDYLGKSDHFYYNLVMLKTNSAEEIIKKLGNIDENNYEHRIWLNNYVPFLIDNVSNENLVNLVESILNLNMPSYLQVKILAKLVNKKYFSNEINGKLINILVIKLSRLSDNEVWLIENCAKTILILYKNCDYLITNELIYFIRNDYQTCNIYKIIIYVLIINYCEKQNVDREFISYATDKYLKADIYNDISCELSTTLIYLFNSSNNRFDLLKLGFFLLLKNDNCEIYKFVSIITGKECFTFLDALKSILNHKNLTMLLNDKFIVAKFLTDLYRFVKNLPDQYQKSDTFYLIYNDFYVPKLLLKNIIKSSIVDFFNCN